MPLEGITPQLFPSQARPNPEDSNPEDYADEQVSEVSSIESPTPADDPDYLSVSSISEDPGFPETPVWHHYLSSNSVQGRSLPPVRGCST